VFGVFLLLVIAAFVEAFWSFDRLDAQLDQVRASPALVWIAVWYWIWRGGRDAA
jgi:hypothetical protein